MKKAPILCRDVVRKVCADLGKDLESPECRPVREHLRTCRRCSAWKDSIEKTVELFRRYPAPPHPAPPRIPRPAAPQTARTRPAKARTPRRERG